MAMEPKQGPNLQILTENGFKIQRVDSWWLGDMDDVRDRLVRIRNAVAARVSPREQPEVSMLTARDLPEVQRILSSHGLATLRDRSGRPVFPDWSDGALPDPFPGAGTDRQDVPLSTVHDPALSTVIRMDGRVVGVQLVQRLAEDLVFVHARAIHADFLSISAKLNVWFFLRLLDPVYAPIQRFLFSAEVGGADETIAMARRFQARPLGEFCLLSLQR